MNIEKNRFVTDRTLYRMKYDRKFNKIKEIVKKHCAKEFYFANHSAKYNELFEIICSKSKIKIDNSRFIYYFDFNYIPDNNRGVVFDNISVDYRKILQSGLENLKYPQNACQNKYCDDHNRVIDSLIVLSERIVSKLEKKKPYNYKKKIEWFKNIRTNEAANFEEAVQRVFFLNQVLWQTNHPLMGFGLLDTMLEKYYEKDKSEGIIDENTTISIIEDFYETLHRYYWYKSHALIGDTGQLIIVGKSDYDGNYHCSDLTYYFIKALKNVKLPDPKVLLRVSSKTPRNLIEIAIECIVSGIGSPIFANDDVIIPTLIEFGVEEADAYDYATAACWEPLIAWKCPISNNLTVLNYLKPLDYLFKREPLDNIKTYEQFMDKYYFYLERNINAAKKSLDCRRFAYDPLVSTFIGGCYEQKKDVSEGGARYNDYGMTTVALGNTVDALLNIKNIVFENKTMTLNDIKKVLILNFENEEPLYQILKEGRKKYGCDDKEIIDLSNEIIKQTSKFTMDFVNYLGGKLKFGLSSPAYIDQAKGFGASFDGRKKNEPFYVHISSEDSSAHTELINFAAELDYGENRFNGNVVDFMVTPSFIMDNFAKFVDFIMASIQIGFFEMQMNVISSEILIKAKNNPKEFPNLIVRVWGFSAYFNDLPEDYKNIVIERALRNEGKAV